MTAEERRLRESRERSADWTRWGPYLSESRRFIGGICDRDQAICFAVSLDNGNEVNEGYSDLDSTPTYSYLRFLCQRLHSGDFAGDRCFDLSVEYAKASVEDILIRVTAVNRGPEPATLHLLPALWFGHSRPQDSSGIELQIRSVQQAVYGPLPTSVLQVDESTSGRRWLYHEGYPEVLFLENETGDSHDTVSAASAGTQAVIRYGLALAPRASAAVKLRLCDLEGTSAAGSPLGTDFDLTLAERRREADDYYAAVISDTLSADDRRAVRQACAGLLCRPRSSRMHEDRWTGLAAKLLLQNGECPSTARAISYSPG